MTEILDMEGECLEVKRLQLPGSVKIRCENCGEMIDKDFQDQISYPVVGREENLSVYCYECDHEWIAGTINLKVSLEVNLKDIIDE